MTFGDIREMAHDLILWLMSSNYHIQMHQFSIQGYAFHWKQILLFINQGAPFLDLKKQTIFASLNLPHLDAKDISSYLLDSVEGLVLSVSCTPFTWSYDRDGRGEEN